jgi:hypothetical protein
MLPSLLKPTYKRKGYLASAETNPYLGSMVGVAESHFLLLKSSNARKTTAKVKSKKNGQTNVHILALIFNLDPKASFSNEENLVFDSTIPNRSKNSVSSK